MAKLLFIPASNIFIHLEQPGAPAEISALVRAGKWQPPVPYQHLSASLDAVCKDNLVIIAALPVQNMRDPVKRNLRSRSSEVLLLLQNGLTTRQIALRLGIQPRTVYFHIARLKQLYQASTRAELAAKSKPTP